MNRGADGIVNRGADGIQQNRSASGMEMQPGMIGASRHLGLAIVVEAFLVLLFAVSSMHPARLAAQDAQAVQDVEEPPDVATRSEPEFSGEAEASIVEQKERDDANPSASPTPAVAPDAAVATGRFPTNLPDGRPLNRVGIFESHVAELVPSNYTPMLIDQFRRAVEELRDQSTDDEASRLTGSVYWIKVINDMLVSDRSVITIESEIESEITRSLGRVNFAIEQPIKNNATSNPLPRLESESNGNLVAVFRGDDPMQSRIEFAWQLRGTPRSDGHLFELNLPRTPQTRIVIAAPKDLLIESLDGVLRKRPGPPPDATFSDPDFLWYELDAGGLANLQLLTHRMDAQPSDSPLIVRRSSVQYQADPSGLSWTYRSVIQRLSDRSLPGLEIHGTTVTGARVNDNEIPFTVKASDRPAQEIKLEVPVGLLTADDRSIVVTLAGRTAWNQSLGWADLPMPLWIGPNIEHVSAADDVLLDVLDPMQVMVWELPAEWSQPNVLGYAAEGPPVALVLSKNSAPPKDPSRDQMSWSRVRFTQRPIFSESSTALRLSAMGGSLNASARIWVKVDSSRLRPIQLRLQPQWSVDAIQFAHSGRVVEERHSADDSRQIVLWPEAEDTDQSMVAIDLRGSRIWSEAAEKRIPATWFVRPSDMRGELVAAIAPPSNLNWSGATAIQPDLIQVEDLSEAQNNFLGVLDQNTLLFRPETGRTPEVQLQSPSVSFNAMTRLRVTREGDQVAEELTVQITSPSQTLDQLEIQTGQTDHRPPFTWSISGSIDSPTTSLPASDIREGESEGIIQIRVSDKGLGRRHFIARRKYPLGESTVIQLPSVRGAALQDSEVLVGPGLLVRRQPPSVQRVPNRDGNFARLRYDAVQQPTIKFVKSDRDPNVPIVWRQHVRVTASSRGTDRIEATFKISPTVPLKIQYEPDMNLASVTRNGTAVDLSKIPERPIELPPAKDVQTIQIVWNRSLFGSRWFRRFRMPRITVPGTVLQSEYELVAAADSFAPASVFNRSYRDSHHADGVKVRAGSTTTLFRRNIALAIGWLIAILVFAAGWLTAQRSPLVVAAAVIVLGTILLAWWPWRFAVIGWLIVPTVSAALLAVSRAWAQPRLDAGEAPDASARHSEIIPEKPSGDFSLSASGRMLLCCLLVGWSVGSAAGQTSRSESNVDPVDVIIPISSEELIPGPMIYVPKSVYAQLFPTSRAKAQEPRFEWATYVVDVDSAWKTSNALAPATIEAEYRIRIADGDHRTNLVRLPLAAERLRRIEIIENLSRIVQFRADAQGQVVASFPRGDTFHIRVTLLPQISEVDPWSRLSVAIPPVAATQLLISSSQEIEAVRIGGSGGPVFSGSELGGRLDLQIGPVPSLEIDFREVGRASNSNSSPLQRRYWIHASALQTTIDCEVEPPQSIAAGESFQFLIRDSAVPRLTSPSWTLQSIDVYTPGRQRMTVVSQQDSPGPVGLMWTRPTPVLIAGESAPVSIPEVISANFGENAEAWVGLHCGEALRLTKPDPLGTEPLAVDQFLSTWKGHLCRIESSYVAIGEIAPPLLTRAANGSPAVQQRHDLRVRPDRLELFYDATLTPSEVHANQYRLRIPSDLNLVRVVVDGQSLDGQPIRSEETGELLLGDFVGLQPIEISVVGVQSIASNRRFTPPKIHIEPVASTVDDYRISRDHATVVTPIQSATTGGPLRGIQQATQANSLEHGLIPLARWSIQTSGSPDERGTELPEFRVRERPTRFDCRQLITLNKLDADWTMKTHIAFPGSVPDFIDVEIPTQWCDSLVVQPTRIWSQQPAIDPSQQVIRIRCEGATRDNKMLTLQGRLQESVLSRVTVPAIRVLGQGPRRVHVNVPAQLEETIQWRSKAVEVIPALPPRWSELATEGPRRYFSAAPSWSIELAPLQEKKTEAVAFQCDTQVFPQDAGAILICHWDLLPGALDSIDVRLPPGAQCLGTWTAGQAVVFEKVSSGGKRAEVNDNVIRIPLALSRLAQTVDLLLEMPLSTMKMDLLIPQLVGIRVTENWYTSYVPETDSPAVRQDAMLQKRAVQLATSVVQAVESFDSVAQRPREEFEIWIQQWLARYRMIAAAVGHRPKFDRQSTDPRSRQEKNESNSDRRRSVAMEAQWIDLDARLGVYVDRFLAGPASSFADPIDRAELQPDIDRPIVLGVAHFEGFVPSRIMRLSAFKRPRWVQPVSNDDRGLRTLLVNLLTLLAVAGLLACLRPIQQFALPIVRHPAFWLGLLGLALLAVAPGPLGAVLLVVAIVVPCFPSKRVVPSS